MEIEDGQVHNVQQAYVTAVCPDRDSLYECFLRNQLWVPTKADPLMNLQFMKGIVDGTYWMPFCSEIKFRHCAEPPPRQELVIILLEVLRANENYEVKFRTMYDRTCAEIAKRPPSVFWQLTLIATSNENHYLFAKDYQRPRIKKAERKPPSSIVPNNNGFFDGLPMKNKKVKRTLTFGVNPIQREAEAMQKMLDAQANLNMRVELQRARFSRASNAPNSFDNNPVRSVQSELIENVTQNHSERQPNIIGNEEDMVVDTAAALSTLSHGVLIDTTNKQRKMPTRKDLKKNAAAMPSKLVRDGILETQQFIEDKENQMYQI